MNFCENTMRARRNDHRDPRALVLACAQVTAGAAAWINARVDVGPGFASGALTQVSDVRHEARTVVRLRRARNAKSRKVVGALPRDEGGIEASECYGVMRWTSPNSCHW